MVVHWHKSCAVDNECSLHNFIILARSVCQKLSNSVEIWWSSDQNKLGHFCLTLYKIINIKKYQHCSFIFATNTDEFRCFSVVLNSNLLKTCLKPGLLALFEQNRKLSDVFKAYLWPAQHLVGKLFLEERIQKNLIFTRQTAFLRLQVSLLFHLHNNSEFILLSWRYQCCYFYGNELVNKAILSNYSHQSLLICPH